MLRRLPLSIRFIPLALLSLLLVQLLAGCGAGANANTGTDQATSVRLGYFPNLTHAAGVVGVANGTFQKSLRDVKLTPTTFNAGPALVEALFGGSIDIGYVGPNPAINGYIKSQGTALRIVAGASSGGALFIVRSDSNIKSPADLANKKFASPQLGGTQDVALRYYLQQHGLNTKDKGGNVEIVPTDNANILTLFLQKQIDGAWVPEPWATRLVTEAHGEVFVDERTLWPDQQFATTLVIVSKKFADANPGIVKKFLQAHVETVQYIQQHPEEALQAVNTEIKRITGKDILPAEPLKRAYANLTVTYDPLASTLVQSATQAFDLGFLGSEKPNLANIYDLGPLNAILQEKNLPAVKGL